jgi:DNA-directed RNA polymerase subunit N (RpoN/RPB10)
MEISKNVEGCGVSEGVKKRAEYVPIDPGLKVDEVAAELGIDRSSARRLIISQIPHYVVAAGRRKKSYRVRRSVLMRWREAQERQSLKRSNRPASLSVVNGERET